MPSNDLSPFYRAWYRWKTLRLPWRKRFLVGHDLQGNTFWEFRDLRTTDSGRWRRIMQAPRRVHHTEVKVSPQWHQWLRHTRRDPPSIEEQQADVSRQARMKVLAAEADARWAAKPSLSDAPGAARGQPMPTLARTPPADARSENASRVDGSAKEESLPSEADASSPDTAQTQADVHAQRQETWRRMQQQEKQRAAPPGPSPWTRNLGGPSENWQPKPWEPPASKRS